MRLKADRDKGERAVNTGSELKYIILSTKMGWVGILAGDNGLIRTTLPCRSKGEVLYSLGRRVSSAVWSQSFFAELVQRFNAYFEGKEVPFPDELDPQVGTHFQRSVWRMTRLIPYGETRSYHWVAEGLGDRRLARACGQALGRNSLPIIIPCHRVVGSDGGLCGFGGGLALKEALLHLENPGLFSTAISARSIFVRASDS